MPTPKPPVKKIKNYSGQIIAFTVLSLIVAGAGGWYGFQQYTKYQAAKSAYENIQITTAGIVKGQQAVKDEFTELNKQYEIANKTRSDIINAVLPKEESYREYARYLEKYEAANNDVQHNSPFFMGSLSFEGARIDKDKDYAILPFSVSIQTTREKLFDFLKYIESSGSLEEGTRIMDVRSIGLSFPLEERQAFAEQKDEAKVIPISLSLQTYFQKP